MTVLSALIFLLGFWVFALGELALLRRSMLMINEIRKAITDRLFRKLTMTIGIGQHLRLLLITGTLYAFLLPFNWQEIYALLC